MERICSRKEMEKVEILQGDPLLAEITSQICPSGVCFAKGDKLPICSPKEAKKLERCIVDVKAKLPPKCEPFWSKPVEEQPEGCYNPFSTCRASLGCRLGGEREI